MKYIFKYFFLLFGFGLLISGLANAGFLVLNNQTDYTLTFPNEFYSDACYFCGGVSYKIPKIGPRMELPQRDFKNYNYSGNDFPVSSPSWTSKSQPNEFTVVYRTPGPGEIYKGPKTFMVPCEGKACVDEPSTEISYTIEQIWNGYKVTFYQKKI